MQHFINLNMKSLSVWASSKDTLYLNSSNKALAQYKFLQQVTKSNLHMSQTKNKK